jgi:hypothetical protein
MQHELFLRLFILNLTYKKLFCIALITFHSQHEFSFNYR